LFYSPEAVVEIDGLYYNVGGLLTDIPRAYLNRTALAENATFDPNAFHFVSYRTGKPEAPFRYRPRRGAPEDIVWPPRGLRLDVKFRAPFWAPRYHQVNFECVQFYFCYDSVHYILFVAKIWNLCCHCIVAVTVSTKHAIFTAVI